MTGVSAIGVISEGLSGPLVAGTDRERAAYHNLEVFVEFDDPKIKANLPGRGLSIEPCTIDFDALRELYGYTVTHAIGPRRAQLVCRCDSSELHGAQPSRDAIELAISVSGLS
ncbi:hypothetical protein EVAR_49126_1 [Eumeta japonica]|uniref:Uncharacterized protein n=1 Tax=Eumeta variegata TaxID=151549 RepID=A0A4C1YQZ4_EUMVA|nr:hypothetical protein EVAR_49126_1 [Eumeta japonica]